MNSTMVRFSHWGALRMCIAIRQGLSKSGCKVYIGSVRLEVAPGRHYTYPDLFVTCSEADRASTHLKKEPVLIAEVLSESTEAQDRGFKWKQYQNIPSIQCYLLISQSYCSAEAFTRSQNGDWVYHLFDDMEKQVPLPLPGLSVPLSAIYEGVTFPEMPDFIPEEEKK